MVSFLHAADLHLGLRVTRFDRAMANKVREARFTALDNIRKEAVERRVDFLVIAGDLFDDDAVDSTTARRAFELLAAFPMPVYVLSGNHDPLIAGGVWDRPPWSQSDTKRVRLLRAAEPVQVASGVVLFPCPVFRKTSLNDPTTWILPDSTGSADIRIGLAHGSLKARENLKADDHLIARHAASDKQLDYLALGHWHSRALYPDPQEIERTAYPGVHEPFPFEDGWSPYSGNREQFLDSGKGEVLHVRVRGPGQPPEIEPVEVGHFIWQEEEWDLVSDDDLSRLIGEVAVRPNIERRLLHLRLKGVLNATSMLRLEELRQILANRYLLGELDESELHVEPTVDEMREAAGHGVLRRVLDQLRADAQSDEANKRRVADRAILLLYQIAKEANP